MLECDPGGDFMIDEAELEGCLTKSSKFTMT